MGSAAESPSTAKIQLVSNQMLPNIPMHSLGAPTNTAIENKLPCFQQRRKEGKDIYCLMLIPNIFKINLHVCRPLFSAKGTRVEVTVAVLMENILLYLI